MTLLLDTQAFLWFVMAPFFSMFLMQGRVLLRNHATTTVSLAWPSMTIPTPT
jgi:PIN domain nuclease of toxin-antitoxin system